MTAASEIHDLLVIPSNKKLYRFKATPDGFENHAPVDFYADEHRKVMNIAQAGSPDLPRGPAFAILPNKPDPSTSQICCYLINSEHLQAANPWTADAWSSEPTRKDNSLELEPNKQDAEPLELLAACSDGTVFWVREDCKPEPLELSIEAEIFVQLRNGLVAGTAYCQRAGKVLPLINVSSIFPKGA